MSNAPTPDELRHAADVVELWNSGRVEPRTVAEILASQMRATADEREAEAEKSARRERLAEELAQTIYEADFNSGLDAYGFWRDEYLRTARAVIDRFPILPEADDE